MRRFCDSRYRFARWVSEGVLKGPVAIRRDNTEIQITTTDHESGMVKFILERNLT